MPNKATPLTVDANGNPIPVFDSDSRKTQPITLAAASAVTAQTIPFAKTSETMPSLVLGCSGSDTITFTAKKKGKQGEDVSITVATAGTFGIVISGKAITITPASAGTACSLIESTIEADPAMNELVDVTYTTAAATIDAAQAKAYLNGWDDGQTPCVVRMWCDTAFFYGKGQSALITTKTAEIPVSAGAEAWEIVLPGELLCVKGTESKIVYLTPSRKY